MKYEHLWADMHSNIHHNQMQDLDRWYQHAKQVMDFWPIAYFPSPSAARPPAANWRT